MVRVGENVAGGALIQARGLDKSYQRGSEEIHVLHGLNLDIAAGEFVAFMGPSGSGKTTLLNLLGGLDRPSAGAVTIGDRDITAMTRRELAAWRARHVGFVFQLYNLLPVLTAFQNVELPLLLTSLARAERRKRVETALRIVGLQDRRHHYPRQLSGGQEQRVAIARAIAKRPDVLLCDEPTGALDISTGIVVLEAIERINKELGTTTAVITHNSAVAAMADRVVSLADGRIVSEQRNETKVSPRELRW
jgi:putative ABC transport system ATP-binding protein